MGNSKKVRPPTEVVWPRTKKWQEDRELGCRSYGPEPLGSRTFDLPSETQQDIPFVYKVPPHPLGSKWLVYTIEEENDGFYLS